MEDEALLIRNQDDTPLGRMTGYFYCSLEQEAPSPSSAGPSLFGKESWQENT